MNETQKPPVKIWNVPNLLSLLRMALVPVFMAAALYLPKIDGISTLVCCLVPALIFILTSLTDMLDGKIARKYHLITDFGKFLDPLADKFMVIAAVFGLVCRGFREKDEWLFWVFMVMLIVTIFRELAVASIRLVASGAGVVVPANMLGKVKTVTQMACIILALVEPVAHDLIGRAYPDFYFKGFYALTYLTAAVAIVFTVISGVVYLKAYWKYLDPEK